MSKKKDEAQHTCQQPKRGYPRALWGQDHKPLCGNRAKVEVNGKWYCGVHDPVKAKAKKELNEARWDAESKVRLAGYAVEAMESKLIEVVEKNQIDLTGDMRKAFDKLQKAKESLKNEEAKLRKILDKQPGS